MRRIAPVLGLLVLSPICAEYLIGYTESVGRPLDLLSGLLILAPLYGTVAVMIREVTRRTGRGWPTILLLGLAFGLLQAGLIDQSLFTPAASDIPTWETDRRATLVPALGLSAAQASNWVIGHLVWSFAAPIAVVEACVPDRAGRAWLGRAGMTVMVVLYLSAAALIFSESRGPEGTIATPTQLATTAVIAAALIVAAFAVPRRTTAAPGRLPPLWVVAAVAAAVLTAHVLLPATWPGVAVDVVVMASGGLLLWRWSGRPGWGRRHVLVVAGAALVVYAALSFVVDPVGDPPAAARYATNTVLALTVLALLTWAYRRVGSVSVASADKKEFRRSVLARAYNLIRVKKGRKGRHGLDRARIVPLSAQGDHRPDRG